MFTRKRQSLNVAVSWSTYDLGSSAPCFAHIISQAIEVQASSMQVFHLPTYYQVTFTDPNKSLSSPSSRRALSSHYVQNRFVLTSPNFIHLIILCQSKLCHIFNSTRMHFSSFYFCKNTVSIFFLNPVCYGQYFPEYHVKKYLNTLNVSFMLSFHLISTIGLPQF